MKRIILLIIALCLIASCQKQDEILSEVNEPLVTAAPIITTTPFTTTTTTPPETTANILPTYEIISADEIPLADGAVLIREEMEYNFRFSIFYDTDNEAEYLFGSWSSDWNYSISPDLTKIAYLNPLYDHRGGRLNILDVTERKINEHPEIDGIKIYATDVTGLMWLDDEVLLLIVSYVQGSATAGGSLHYYNINDGSNGKIIPLGDHFQIAWAEADGSNLNLIIARHRDYSFHRGDFVTEIIPISKIYDLIENDETLILNVPHLTEEE